MRTHTHASFGILFILGIGLLLGITLNWTIAVLTILGALLPDIDTPKSAIGNFLRPIAAYIERKFGHRQATHSLLAVLILGLITTPLICVNLFCWIALFSGYLSHLLIDTTNKLGVPLFYPSPLRAVMPKPERWRIRVGSKAETIILITISIIVFALIPINQIGLFRALHRMIKDTQSAIADYRTWADTHRVYAIVKGTFNLSQQPIVSQFEVLGIENRNALVIYDQRADKIYTIGTDEDASIYPKAIHCIKGEPISVITKKIHIQYELLGNLANRIPQQGQTFIKGTVNTGEKVSLPRIPDAYETIRVGFNEVELRYARKPDFEDVGVSTIFALSGEVYLRTILPANPRGLSESLGSRGQNTYFANNAMQFAVLPTAINVASQPSYRVHTTEMYIQNVRSHNEILVREGQFIKTGDLIALLTHNREKLKLEEQTIHRQIAQLQAKPSSRPSLLLDSHALFLASQKIKARQRGCELQQEIFKTTKKLYESKAISHIAFIKEQQKLKQAEVAIIEAEQEFEQVKQKLDWEQKQRQYQVDQAILKLNSIQDEREQNKICSAVNARILFIRTNAINNNNMTIAIKLLVNAPEPSSLPQSIPKPKIESPEPKEVPKKENFIKVIDRNVEAEPVCPRVSKSVHFLQSTLYKKKTHKKFSPKGGNNEIQKTTNFDTPLFPISLLRKLRYQPIASEHYHQPSFFT